MISGVYKGPEVGPGADHVCFTMCLTGSEYANKKKFKLISVKLGASTRKGVLSQEECYCTVNGEPALGRCFGRGS
jgi:hypothetical protein